MKAFLLAPLRTFPVFLLLAIGLVLTPACVKPDPMGMENATNMTTKLPDLMNKSVTKTYNSQKSDIENTLADLTKAQEHAAAQKSNKEIAGMWKILRDEQLVPFFDRWKEKEKLDKDFVKEAVAQVKKSLEAIKKAEQNKRK